MSCETFLAILDIPESLRSPDEVSRLEHHLQTCASCQAQAVALETGVLAFQQTPPRKAPAGSLNAFLGRLPARSDMEGARARPLEDEDLSLELTADRIKAAREATRSVGGRQGELPPERGWSSRLRDWLGGRLFGQPVYGWAGAVLAMLLVVWLVPTSDVRTKGRAAAPLFLDLEAQVELPSGQPLATLPGQEPMVLHSSEGLLFSFQVSGGNQLVLIERDPEHRLKVIYERRDLPPAGPAPSSIAIATPQGKLMRYVPDGPAGDYLYLAVVSAKPMELSARQLDTLWSSYVSRLLDPLATPPNGELTLDALEVHYDPESARSSADHAGRQAP